ncbi:MAG: glutamine-hydrolyzing carbamoyl-phosphate synthase small subunit [Candidatus Auribacterota bacterium]
MIETVKAVLVLEDGTVFWGKGFVPGQEKLGEVVFNTSMTGYQEILTDPSYKGQIVTMTYPHIGNYGTNDVDQESRAPMVEGFIVRDLCLYPSNFRSKEPLLDYLKRNNIMVVTDMDTRAITLHIRQAGAMKGVLSTTSTDVDALLKKVKAFPGLVGRDMVCKVTCQEPYEWKGDSLRTEELDAVYEPRVSKSVAERFNIVAFDFGIKYNMLRLLERVGCKVTVVPASTNAAEIEKLNPDGVFLSNGPGDPEAVTYAIDTVSNLVGKYPIFGICLGHQILALALGGKTYKLKFGHRGVNHPVSEPNGTVEITCQNHGFAVDMDSLPKDDVELTHVNLNDRTVEGFKHKRYPLFSVQYHPESSAGPHDSRGLFTQFIDVLTQNKKRKG